MWLVPGQTNDGSNPVLRIITFGDDGLIVDAYSVSYAIYDRSTENLFNNPSVLVAKTPLNVTDGFPTGNRVALGEYVPTWSVPGDQTMGLYQIRWYVKLLSTDNEVEYRQDFEIASFPAGLQDFPNVSVFDMRNEGFPSSFTDLRLYQAIKMASRRIENLLENIFTPQRLTLPIDGSGSPVLTLPFPIIALESVKVLYSGSTAELDVGQLGYRVYNRHMKGMFNPDDRMWPHIEVIPKCWPGHLSNWDAPLSDRWVFPRGAQNIIVKGVFGYTDPDDSPLGSTPDDIKWATVRLARRFLPKQANQAAVDAIERSGLITSESTRDQSYTIAQKMQMGGPLTGDPFLDQVLLQYLRPASSATSREV